MNWYVLFVLTQYEDQICRYIKDSQIHIFSAKYEHYRRDKDCIEIKSLFPGYLFVKTNMNQMEFNDWLNKLNHRKGIIKQLSYTSISALKDEEIKMFDLLLDDIGVLRMSSGYFDNKKLVICSGPLVGFDDYIVKYDKRNKEARLCLHFIEQSWKAGVEVIEKKED